MSAAPQFRLNTEARDPATVSRAQAEAIAETLARLFGTPDVPSRPYRVRLKLELLQTAAGPIGRRNSESSGTSPLML